MQRPLRKITKMFLLGGLLLGLSPFSPSFSLETDSTEFLFLSRLSQIQYTPLHLLPKYDCDLDELEREVLHYYQKRQTQDVPDKLKEKLQEKRKGIDYRRSYIDSLYYLEALRQINQTEPNWNQAIQYAETSLTQNRFFLRSILFKWSSLLREAEKNQQWGRCLQYAHEVLTESYWQPKLQTLGNNLYEKVLTRMAYLIQVKLYPDAQKLYDTLHANLKPNFPLNYLPYKEKNLLHSAYQGMFDAYFSVAQRAFDQKLYPLTQKHALLAFDYYSTYESYMSGVNPTLTLLEQLLQAYQSFMRYSEEDEKTFYKAMTDTIRLRTGLEPGKKGKSTEKVYNLEEELWAVESSNLDLNSPDSTPILKKEARDRDSLYYAFFSTPVVRGKLNLNQAQKEFDISLEKARLFSHRRQFLEARTAYQRADTLRRYYPLKTAADFASGKNENDLLAVEQLLNKAQYRLWNAQNASADSIALLAQKIAYECETSQRAPFQNLLDAYQQQRQKLLCQTLKTQWSQKLRDLKRQISYAQVSKADQILHEIDTLYVRTLFTTQASCIPDTTEREKFRKELSLLKKYKNLIDSSSFFIQKGDSLSYIQYQLTADKFFVSEQMNRFISSSTTFFARLAYEKNFPLLVLYALWCQQNQQKEKADFILSYLKETQYNSPLLEHLQKQQRKNNRD